MCGLVRGQANLNLYALRRLHINLTNLKYITGFAL